MRKVPELNNIPLAASKKFVDLDKNNPEHTPKVVKFSKLILIHKSRVSQQNNL